MEQLKDIAFFNHKNKQKTFADYPTKKGYVIFFYPRANTPGCSAEVRAYHLEEEKITTAGYVMLGISLDKVEHNCKFAQKNELNFDLISDDGKLCEYFNVMRDKKMFGKSFRGIERSTFILDNNLSILLSLRKVKPVEHIKQVLEFVDTH